jgi:hypothetical protein
VRAVFEVIICFLELLRQFQVRWAVVLKRDGWRDSTHWPACSSLANRVVLSSMMNEVRIALLMVLNKVEETFTQSEAQVCCTTFV